MNDRAQNVLGALASFLLIVFAWELSVRGLGLPPYVLPSAIVVFQAILDNWSILLTHSLWTGIAVIGGFALAVAVAIPLAMMIVISAPLGRLLYPPMVATQAIPKIALAPLFIVWFGFGLLPKVGIAFLIAFFPIAIDTIAGLRSVEPGLIQLARSMGAPAYRVFLKLRFPNALPMVFSGFKVASTLAVVGALTGEFVGADKGLGYILLQATGNLNTPLLFATIIVLSILALVFFYLVELCERIVIPWHISQR